MTALDARLTAHADALLAAHEQRRAVPPPTDTDPELTVADAYAIQRHNVDRRAGRGVRRSGYKVGLTSPQLQRRLDTDEPDFGQLLSDAFLPEGTTVPSDRFLAPRVEPEVAFVLAAPLAAHCC